MRIDYNEIYLYDIYDIYGSPMECLGISPFVWSRDMDIHCLCLKKCICIILCLKEDLTDVSVPGSSVPFRTPDPSRSASGIHHEASPDGSWTPFTPQPTSQPT